MVVLGGGAVYHKRGTPVSVGKDAAGCGIRIWLLRAASERRRNSSKQMPEIQGQDLALPVLNVPYSLDSGTWFGVWGLKITSCRRGAFGSQQGFKLVGRPHPCHARVFEGVNENKPYPDTVSTFENHCLAGELTFADPFQDSGVMRLVTRRRISCFFFIALELRVERYNNL